MKKNKILLTLAFFATLTLVACGKKNVTTENNTTTDNNNTVVVNDHDRGSEDNSLPKIDLPDVIIKDNNLSFEATDESISLGSGDYVETNAGSGSSETVDGAKFVSATVNIGYEFLGWYCGDKLVSTELKYKCKAGEENIAAKFRLKEGFEYFEFTSDEEECIVTGLKEDYPTNLVIPEGVTEIVQYAFSNTDLVNVTLPESLESLGSHAFYECYELKSLTFKVVPYNMGSDIAEDSGLKCVFVPNDFNEYGYSNLASLLDAYNMNDIIKSTDTQYYVKDGFIFRYYANEWYLASYIGSDIEIELPVANDVVSEYYIGYEAFAYSEIEKVKLSQAVKYIGNSAFYQCYDLKEIDFGNSITKIDGYAFYSCDSLKEIVIPDSVTLIESYAFYDCDNLSKVTVGKNVETINYNAFYNCGKLYYIYNYSNLDIKITEDGNEDYGYIAYNATIVITGEEEEPSVKVKDGFVYTVNGNYVTLESYLGSNKDIVIPTFDGKKIIIGEGLFYCNQEIETVTFNDDCVKIESSAFYNCDNLKKINTAGVIDIDSYAFNDCDYLEEAILPNVVYIRSHGFYGCYKLKTVECPNLTYLSDYAFYYCQELESINLEKVERIDNSAFYYCVSLKEAIMNEATSIGSYAFYECRMLEKAIMPKVTSIANNAFQYCYRLRTIDISRVSSIGNYAFYDNYSLISITIPSTLTTISGSYAFYECYSIVEIVNYSALDLKAGYSGNGYLTSYAKSVITDPADTILTYENNLITYPNSDNKTVLVGIIDRSVKKLSIPSSVDIVRANALYGCDVLEDLEFNQPPEGEYIGYLGFYFGAYYQYSSNYAYSHNYEFVPRTLKTVRYNGNITAIPRYALYSCYDVENLYIGKNVTAINQSAFDSNHFKNIYFDGTIEDWCNINFITEDRNPLYFGGKIYFKNGDSYSELDVIEVPDTIDYIGDYQFYRFNMKKVILPEGITSIGNYAFYGCYNLKEIVIKDGLESIGERAFEYSLLKSIVLPNSLETIYESAFANCRNLISVKLGNSVTSIGNYAFQNCSLLYNFNAPNTLASLGEGVFMGCETLEELTLEDTAVTQLKAYLFANCVNLESFGFPTGLTSIDTTTFENCGKFEFRTFKNGCYLGTEENPFRWLVKARAKTILECIVHPDCEKIYDGAFSGCKNLKKIIIPATCICGTCLKGLTNVEYVEAPYTGTGTFGQTLFGMANANLTSIKTIIINGGAIADNAFTDISYDVEITIKGNLTAIGEKALKGRDITSFIAPSTLKTIGNYAFQDCILLEEVDLGTVESIGTGAFKGCTALSSLLLSTSSKFTIIPVSAFEDCSSLSTVKISTNLREIRDYAFKNSGLATITTTTPNLSTMFVDVTKLGDEAFMGCKFTKLRYISSTIKNLGVNVFKECLELTTVTDYSVGFVGTSMFEGCTALTKFSSTSNTSRLNDNAFKGCSSLSNLTIRDLTYIGNYALSETALTSFKQGESFGESATETSRILNMNSYAFYNCKALTTVYLYSNSIVFEYKSGYSTYTATNVFEGCSNLVNVTLPSKMSVIYDCTFKDCTSLTTFDFSNITEIRQYAFQNTGFIHVELSEKVTTLQRYIFDKCANLESAVIGCNLITGMFRDCVKLESVTLSGNDTKVWAQAFYRCPLLKTVILNEGITEIGNNAFAESGITNIIIPSTITKLGDNVFDSCTALESVVIPGKITSFGTNIFQNCDNLTTVVIEEGITKIPNYMFGGCTSLESVEFPTSMTTIGQYAFQNCTNLESIILPKGVTSIGSKAFSGCTNLNTIYNYSDLVLEAESENNGYVAYYANETGIINKKYTFANEEDIIYYDESAFSFALIDGEYFLISYNYEESEIILPTRFTYGLDDEFEVTEYRIYENAFFGKTSITKLTIPNSVKGIGLYAFAGCTNLKTIYNNSDFELTIGSKENGYVAYYANTITTPFNNPNNIKTDENGFVFAYVDNKGYLVGYTGNEKFLVLPNSFTFNETEVTEYEIYRKAFYGNVNIISVKIPASVTAIGEYAFKDCYKLVEVFADSSILDTGYLSNYAFETHTDLTEDSKLVIDNGFVFVFYEDEKACLVGYIGTDSEITIPTSFDYNDETITDIVISDYAFVNSNITKVTIPASILAIGNYAFMDSKLEEVVIEDSTTPRGLGNGIFKNCKITKATISSDMIKYVNYYDAKNNALKELVITSGTEIEANALRELPLKKVTLPDSITSIGAYAFYKCSKLRKIDLPSGLLSLGECAFNGCSSIENIIIPNTLDTISDRAFYNCDRLRYIFISNPNITIGNQAFSKVAIDNKVKVLCDGSEEAYASLEIEILNGYIFAEKCFYSASKPSNYDAQANHWHYDENNNPVIYRYEEAKKMFDILIPRMLNALADAQAGNCTYVSENSLNARNYLIKDGDNYTITVNAYYYNIPDYWYGEGGDLRSALNGHTSNLVIGLNNDGYYLVNESNVTTIDIFDFYCYLEDYTI